MGSLIQALDDQLDLLARELARHQKEVTFKDDNPLNAENLQAVLASYQIDCAQHEVDYMLGILRSWGIIDVGHLRALADRWVDLIRNRCRSVLSKEATAVHIVALFAIVDGAADDEEGIRRIDVQLEAKRWWDDINWKR